MIWEQLFKFCGAGHNKRNALCVFAYETENWCTEKSTHSADWLAQPVRLLMSYNIEMITVFRF